MTDRQRATVALLSYILKTERYGKNLTVKVSRRDKQNIYQYRFERTFSRDELSLVVQDTYLEIIHDKIYHEKTGKRVNFYYTTKGVKSRMELEVPDDKNIFEGVTPNRNVFRGECITGSGNEIEYIKITDPETDIEKYEYVVEFE